MRRVGALILSALVAVAILVGLDALSRAQISTPGPILPAACAQTGPSPNITGTTETSFGVSCTFPPGQAIGGTGYLLHVGGVYSAATGDSATGRVRINQNGTLNPTADTLVLTTGALSGIAGATNQDWYGDVWITFYNSTTIDVQGSLFFQATTNVTVPLYNTATYTIDPTKPLTFYFTVQWSSAAAGDKMLVRVLTLK